jgi:hypothetical protein
MSVFRQSDVAIKEMVVASSSRLQLTRATRFTLVCTFLLVIDFIVGFFAFARCTDAGDDCSTANDWVDSVTVLIAGALIVLILGGSVAALIEWYRALRRRPGPR